MSRRDKNELISSFASSSRTDDEAEETGSSPDAAIEIDDDDDDAQADTGHTGASSGRPSNAATLEELRAARLRRLG